MKCLFWGTWEPLPGTDVADKKIKIFSNPTFLWLCTILKHHEHLKLTHKYLTLSPAPLCPGKIFPLGVSSCFPVCTICTRRGEDKRGDTAQIAAELRKLLQEIRVPGLRCAVNHCSSPPAVPLEFPKKQG